jgi:hypothetical protein
MNSFTTLNNGGSLYLVTLETPIDNITNVQVFKRKPLKELTDSDNFFENFKKEPFLSFQSNEILLGKSLPDRVRTSWEQSHGSRYDGNTMLIKNILDESWIFIGDEIYSFFMESKILTFESPVGLSGVTYPWLIDDKDNIYLLSELTVGHSNEIKELLYHGKDPYMLKNKENNFQKMNVHFIDYGMMKKPKKFDSYLFIQ